MLDTVAAHRSRRFKQRERVDQFDLADAVDRDRAALIMRLAHQRGYIVERRKVGFVQVQLDRAERPVTGGGVRKLQRSGQRDRLQERAGCPLRSEMRGHVGSVLRRHVGDAGNAKGAQLGGGGGKIGRHAAQRSPQPLVFIEQASGKASVDLFEPWRRRGAGEQGVQTG